MPDTRFNKIGRYEIISKLGNGLYGTVYLAIDPSLDRRVAIKIINPDYPHDLSEYCPREGQIVSRLKHRNIIQIYDIGYHLKMPYMVFEYVQGQPLKQILKIVSHQPFDKILSLVAPILDAMAYAHSMEVIHLDLNLSNIMINQAREPMIMDFGLSRITHANQMEEKPSLINGSPLYMAPEHFTANNLGTYTDVYALGVMLYKITTGKFPINGDSIVDIGKKIINEDVDFSFYNDTEKKSLFAEFLKGALEKDVSKRYRNALAMNNAFGEYQEKINNKKPFLKDETSRHGTFQFLLLRMKRKKDFPSITKTLTDINRLTSKNANTPVTKLANIILKDYALTNKLLKYVNSAYFGNMGDKISNISRAIVILGNDQLRMIANGLTFFNQLKGDASNNQLRDSMLKSFLSGLIARHLAKQLKLFDIEEAFICGLFQNLGENLTIYYFPEEYQEITQLIQSKGLDKYTASLQFLGINYVELGTEVARSWQLSNTIIDAINNVEEINADFRDTLMTVSKLAIYANLICEIPESSDPDLQEQKFKNVLTQLPSQFNLTDNYLIKLMTAGKDKLVEQSEIMEISTSNNQYFIKLSEWLEKKQTSIESDSQYQNQAVA